MTAPWFDTRTSVKGWLLVLAALVAAVSTYLAFGREEIQVDGPVVRQETNWFRGASGGMDGLPSGPLEYVDGCVLVGGSPVVWPESVSWDEDNELLVIDGDPVPWSGEQETNVSGGGGGTSDFEETAAFWDDDDLTPTSAPCHFGASGVIIYNADSELEVTYPHG